MLFTSLQYAAFLTIVVTVYWALPQKARPALLLVASYVFYAFWNWHMVGLLALASLVAWLVGRTLPHVEGRTKTLLTAASVSTSVGVLVAYKILGAISNAHLNGGALSFAVPVGLSFFTFQAISYVVDVHRGELEPSRSLLDVALYIAFFPHLLAGPIVRAKKLIPSFHAVPRWPRSEQAAEGAELILVGVFKKVVLADPLLQRLVLLAQAPQSTGILTALTSVVGGVTAAYFDITGYVDIARGSAKLLGIDMQRNALYPLLRSTGFADFWRRWQLTLMMWFRDYVYRPVRGDGTNKVRETFALFASFLILGLWHGASLNWLLWGTISGGIIVVERILQTRRAERRRAERRKRVARARRTGVRPKELTKPNRARQQLITGALITVTLPLIAANSLSASWAIYRDVVRIRVGSIDGNILLFTGLAVIGLFALDHREERREARAGQHDPPTTARALAFGAMVLGIVVFSGAVSTPFLYFQF